MIVATLQYQFAAGKVDRYLRTLTMSSRKADGSQLEGQVVSQQSWQLVEDRDDFMVLEVCEQVVKREGPLTAAFQPPPAARKAYLDSCGLLPEAQQEFVSVSSFPTLPEDSLEEGESWLNSELAPNWPLPVEVTYQFVASEERDQQFVAVLSAQARERAEESEFELEGRYFFAVATGQVLCSRLVMTHTLPAGELVRLQVDLERQK